MGTTAAAIAASIGLALVITALTLPGRQSPQVITATTNGLKGMELGALGMGS